MSFKNIYKIFGNDFFLLVFLFFLGFSYIAIENSINPANSLNVDERLWIVRSYYYINSIKNLDFVSGIQTVHPGITVMALSGIFVHIMSDYFLPSLNFYDYYVIYPYGFAFNIPITAFIVFFFFSFYYILRKLKFDRILSFLVLILFSVNIFYILGSTPVDKFATISILLSLSFLLIYVNGKFKFKKYLFLSSFFAGFGVLSKFSALMLVPFSFLVLLYYSPLNKKKYSGAVKDFALYFLIFFLTVIFIFPGFIINPIGSAGAIINAPNNALVPIFSQNPGSYSFFEKLSYYLSFFFQGSFTPLATGLILFFLIFVSKEVFYKGLKTDFSEGNLFYKNILVLFSFGLIYFFYVVVFSSFLFYRYMLPLFLILDIGAAVGLYKIILWCRERYEIKESANTTAIKFITAFYVFQFIHLLLIYSYCVPVTNILLTWIIFN